MPKDILDPPPTHTHKPPHTPTHTLPVSSHLPTHTPRQELGVPKDILDRNMKKATDTKQADYSEVVYEAYGPGGTG